MQHRPECLSADVLLKRAEAPLYGLLCICDRIARAEQRVLDAGYEIGYSAAMDDGWGEPGHIKAAVSAALDAAREAVGSMVIETVGNSAATVEQAVSAIDALKEKP